MEIMEAPTVRDILDDYPAFTMVDLPGAEAWELNLVHVTPAGAVMRVGWDLERRVCGVTVERDGLVVLSFVHDRVRRLSLIEERDHAGVAVSMGEEGTDRGSCMIMATDPPQLRLTSLRG